MLLVYRAGRETKTVRLEPRDEGFRAEIGEQSFIVAVRRSDGARLDLRIDGREVKAIVVRDGERRIVKVDDTDPVTVLRAERERSGGPAARAADGRLTAVMDGQVVAVLASEGDRVPAGAPLVVLEAMKMEMKVVAPFAGRVARLSCSPGEVVSRGRVLVELEPEASAGTTS